MRQIYPDLWQTSTEHPIAEMPEVISHAYLLSRDGGNVLFYSIGREEAGSDGFADDLQRIQDVGGAVRQYLGHHHEATPALARIKRTLASELCCEAREEAAVREISGVAVDLTFQDPETHSGGVQVIPTPGHTPGSACYLCESPHGRTYLFTGDTVFLTREGTWQNGYLPGGESNKSDLRASIELLRTLTPDVVVSAAALGESTFKEVSPADWQAGLDEALQPLM